MPPDSLGQRLTLSDTLSTAEARLTLRLDGTVVTASGNHVARIDRPSRLRSLAHPLMVSVIILTGMTLLWVQFVDVSTKHPAFYPLIVAMMLLSFLAVNYTTALGGRCPFVAISTLPPFDVLFTMPQVASLRSLLPPRELRLANGEVRARLYTHLTCWRATDANGHVLLTAGNAQSYLSMVRRNMRLCKQMQPSMELRDREDRPCGEFLWRSEESAADIRCPAECIDVALAMAIIVRETYLRV